MAANKIPDGSMLVDAHVHTMEHSIDARRTACELIEVAAESHLSGMIFTDHGYCWSAGELEAIQKPANGRVFILSGAEISCENFHFLIYGCPAGPLPDFSNFAELKSYLDRTGAIAGIAHPFTWKGRLPVKQALESGACAVEVYNARRHSLELRNVLDARSIGMAELGGSDEHGDGECRLGKAATLLPRQIASMTEFVTLVKMRRSRAWRAS